jgi:hypothetical protein
MRRIALCAVGFGLLAPLLAAAPAHAQATRTWVSGVGDDANPCSRTAPCKTFPGAISKTAASGEINCLDPAGFGVVTITKSISIVCHHTLGGILSAGTPSAVIINAAAADKVILKGLDINAANTGGNGIRLISAAALTVEDTTIANGTGWGIAIQNGTSTTFQITRVTATNMALGGMQVRPTAAGAGANGVVKDFIGYKNGKGIEVDGNGGGAGNVMIHGGVFSGNSIGVSLVTGATPVSAMVTDASIMNNSSAGISAGANTIARVGRTEIALNATGASGNVSSFGTNQLRGNVSDGSMTLLVPALQ